MICHAAKLEQPIVRTKPRRHAVVERPQRLLERRDGIEAVDLVEIDVIEAEPLQAGRDLIHDVAARQPDRVRARPHPAAHLGRDDDVLALDAEIAQRLAELNLRLAFGIDVGGVDEIDAGVEGAVDERGRGPPDRACRWRARTRRRRERSSCRGRSRKRYWPVRPSGR